VALPVPPLLRLSHFLGRSEGRLSRLGEPVFRQPIYYQSYGAREQISKRNRQAPVPKSVATQAKGKVGKGHAKDE
jgi:hypothetical protein